MKTWALGAVATFSFGALVACGTSNGTTSSGVGGGAGVTVSASHSASSGATTSTGGGGGGSAMDAVCTDPTALTQACLTCVFGLPATDACVKSFVTTCEGDPACTAYLKCQDTCAGGTAESDAGAACLAGDANGDAGSPSMNCVQCCQNENAAGTNTFFGDLITACACTAAAPCATACM